ncbi:restriction endonuclease subunit S (plasmid) [Frondihabitans sp. PAMC 28766]|nr:restriction endonuclease subunit S [Frondihabitans sp. PAMC 28766]
MKPLGELGDFIRGSGLQKKDFTDSGIGCIHYGQIFTHYGSWTTETKSFVSPELALGLRKARPGALIIATTSENDEDVCKAVAWLGDECIAISGDELAYEHSLEPKYVAYFFQSSQFQIQKKRHISGTKVRRVSRDALKTILVPVPPVEVQREIVAILDTFAELEAELAAELAAELKARRRQYEYYREASLSLRDDVYTRWSTLGDICLKVSSGGTPTSGQVAYYGGEIPWLRTQEVDFDVITSTAISITEEGLRNSSANWIPANCVIVAMYGATAAKVAINGIPLTTNQACCNLQVDPTQANHRFVFHWVANEYARLKALGEGTQSNLNAQKVKGYPIPVPSLEKQGSIVSMLDKFDALANDLSNDLRTELAARRKQYEYYRDRLLTFEEVAQ